MRIYCNFYSFTCVFIVSVFVKNENWLYIFTSIFSCVYCDWTCEDSELIVIYYVGLNRCLDWVYLWRVRNDWNLYFGLHVCLFKCIFKSENCLWYITFGYSCVYCAECFKFNFNLTLNLIVHWNLRIWFRWTYLALTWRH